MSLLANETYANPTTPIWVGVNGNTVINGDIEAKYITATSALELTDNSTPYNIILTMAAASNGVTGNPIFQTALGSAFRFGLFSAAAANTTLTPTVAGTNQDILTVGGTIQSTVSQTSNLQLGNQISGTSSIAIGADNVVINSTAVTATSKIFFSFFGVPSIGPGNGPSQGNLIVNPALIVPGTSFRVDLTNSSGVSVAASNVAVTFNWMIIN